MTGDRRKNLVLRPWTHRRAAKTNHVFTSNSSTPSFWTPRNCLSRENTMTATSKPTFCAKSGWVMTRRSALVDSGENLSSATLLVSSIGQTWQCPFSAVSKPNFASKHAFESSRRDLHNALLCTALKSHFFKKLLEFCQNYRKISEFFFKFLHTKNKKWQTLTKKLRLKSCAKECIL